MMQSNVTQPITSYEIAGAHYPAIQESPRAHVLRLAQIAYNMGYDEVMNHHLNSADTLPGCPVLDINDKGRG